MPEQNNNLNAQISEKISADKKKGKNKAKTTFSEGFLEQLELIVIFFAILILVFSFMCKTCRVDGDSMLDTLKNNETVLLWDFLYTPNYGDIVVVHDTDSLNKPIVKRVIGLPGDKIKIEHGFDNMTVTVTHSDGSSEVLNEENYVRYNVNDGYIFGYLSEATYTVGEGEVFVMGDNRLVSMDSRSLGCYDSRQILGKVIFRLTPLQSIGVVN